MALPFYSWSKTAASNANADSTVNWAEGMVPSAVNDSARAMMASTAAFRDDISGAIATGGTSTAYTVTSYQIFSSLSAMANQMVAFTPHTTNTGTTTLNVDGLGAKPLRSAPSTEIPSGTIIQGTPYLALYNNSDAVFYLHGFYGNAYNVPLGSGMDYWLPTAPNSSFVFPIGQAISRTTYATLFAGMGTTYGAGDGSTTFNLPDKTGRVSAMKEASATRLTTAGSGINGGTLGAAGGAEAVTLSLGQLPTGITSAQNQGFNVTVTSSANVIRNDGSNFAIASGGAGTVPQTAGNTVTSTGTVASGNVTTTSNNTSGNAHNNVQPTIVCNYILRII